MVVFVIRGRRLYAAAAQLPLMSDDLLTQGCCFRLHAPEECVGCRTFGRQVQLGSELEDMGRAWIIVELRSLGQSLPFPASKASTSSDDKDFICRSC